MVVSVLKTPHKITPSHKDLKLVFSSASSTSVLRITTLEPTPIVSQYNTSVILKNGGSGWRVGDTVTVTQSGKTFKVKVSEEKFVYTYASDGIASYVTPSNASSGTLTVTDIITNLSNAINNYLWLHYYNHW